MYKSVILKLDEVEPIQKSVKEPLYVGDIVQRLNPERKIGKDRLMGPPMMVVQIAGSHILTNYSE